MASKFEALREAFLSLLEEVYDEAVNRKVSVRALLKRIFGESGIMSVQMKLRNMKKEGKPFTEWSIRIEKIEEALNRLGYTIIPVVMPIEEKEEIEELEEITVKTLGKIGEELRKILDELSESSRIQTQRTATRKNNVEPDSEFLRKLQQRLKTIQRESHETTDVEEVKTSHKTDRMTENSKDDDIFDL
jgi:hypothetical protein